MANKKNTGRQMKLTTGLIAMGIAFTGATALAHSGASGIVLERMKGMTAMRDVMRDLAPIIQGAQPYDALAVSEAGYVIAAHSGDTMRALFPDNSLSGVTYAKSNIWSEWQEFAALADELGVYGKALSSAATVGLQAPVAKPAKGDVPAHAPTQDAPSQSAKRSQQVAVLMGYALGKSSALSSGGLVMVSKPDLPIDGQVGAERIFTRISGTCSACHAKFRKGRG